MLEGIGPLIEVHNQVEDRSAKACPERDGGRRRHPPIPRPRTDLDVGCCAVHRLVAAVVTDVVASSPVGSVTVQKATW